MLLYIIRHAHAEDGEDDFARPLSAKGRRQVRRMAAFLRQAGLFEAREIKYSPLRRARDTARQLARELGGKVRLAEMGALKPLVDPAVAAGKLRRARAAVAVVGHEPHLSSLATLLLGGERDKPRVILKKCAVLVLERTGRTWAVRWLVSPAELERR
ncbi:MAG TPA: phosphohistidine phosphatase SixA [Lacunisphaera sp.]|jgi:phosphohistidine phosphatase|nr:phosphohistidine phosphatase SixA [Lacunisphaera sp.]